MATKLHLSSLITTGLIVESVADGEATIVVSARADARKQACPLCRTSLRRVHSRYIRKACDLPCAGKSVELLLIARRFVCTARFCRRRTFAERFIIAARSRRMSRPGVRRSSSRAGAGW